MKLHSAVLMTALAFVSSCVLDRAPSGLRETPEGPGATVRFDLAHKPLPDVPIPTDTATWPDPTSRTGMRINASLLAPTLIERQARKRFSELEGWGTFAGISVSFDLPRTGEFASEYAGYDGPALDLANIRERHQGDDYDFADDAVYVINLNTGVPVVLDLGSGNFNYTLAKLDKYWANDTRATERNLVFETIDETKGGTITPETFTAADDTDFDGVLDRPNLDDPSKCPGPDPVCDNARDPAYGNPECLEMRRSRDRCMADHLLTWYERESDTLLMRPVLPMDEMTRYAVVITDRTIDGKGHPVKSPFDFVYHAANEAGAKRVQEIFDDPKVAAYYGDLSGSGLSHVSFLWTFTTQPTVDDMKKLRDGLYGQGPFARWEKEFPPQIEVQRAVGLIPDLPNGATDLPGWRTSEVGVQAGCPEMSKNMFIIRQDQLREKMKRLIVEGFNIEDGPGVALLMRAFENVDHMLIGTFRSPFMLEGGPKSTDPNAAFDLNYETGTGEVTEDLIPFWLIVPKETAQFKQPFNVNVYGHGYTGNFVEQILYAGNMAQHGLASIGINAMGHGLAFDNESQELAAKSVLAGACVAPFYDAFTILRSRDLDQDGIADSGGDFWSSYLFHTRDGVRQSILDHIQLMRILRLFGTNQGQMLCRDEKTGWDKPATKKCDTNADGKAELFGDFDGNGVADVGGSKATFGTWGESLGGILSAIHGAIDTNITSAVPGSGGGGLTDIGIRSFQGGVIEAVLLRIWGPLLVSIPAAERPVCTGESTDHNRCTQCAEGEISLRWVMPDLTGTGELEIRCLSPSEIENTTVFVYNSDNDELRCASVDDANRFRLGMPTTTGDKIQISFYKGRHQVKSYDGCQPLFSEDTQPKLVIDTWGKGRYGEGATNATETDECVSKTCSRFQGKFFGEGTPLTAPAEGFGENRQSPAVRRFVQLAQTALEPGDPISFAPYYSIKPMLDPFGKRIPPHAVLTLNTIGDMNVPLNSGIAFARATGALPFLRPDQAEKYPEYANYATPQALYDALGQKTPNQVLVETHVIEGVDRLARHPAGPECAASQNANFPDGTFLTENGEEKVCFPTGCTEATEGDPKQRICYSQTHCDFATQQCVPNELGQQKCDEALYDIDDLDEGMGRLYEQSAPVPLRLARYTKAANASTLSDVWAPRLKGVPYGPDEAWRSDGRPLTGLLDAYILTEGEHTFVNGEPCEAFDKGTYLTNLTARFFMTDGRDIFYLSHPKSHLCLGTDVTKCGYLKP